MVGKCLVNSCWNSLVCTPTKYSIITRGTTNDFDKIHKIEQFLANIGVFETCSIIIEKSLNSTGVLARLKFTGESWLGWFFRLTLEIFITLRWRLHWNDSSVDVRAIGNRHLQNSSDSRFVRFCDILTLLYVDFGLTLSFG